MGPGYCSPESLSGGEDVYKKIIILILQHLSPSWVSLRSKPKPFKHVTPGAGP